MSFLTRIAILLALLSCCATVPSLSYAQTQTAKKTSTASVSGRVTVDGKGRGGIFVGLRLSNFSSAQKPPYKAVTDADGNYRIPDLPAGSYYVTPMSPSFVLANSSDQMGTPLLLSDDDNVEGIDFAMARGCVITGKVTDTDGRPVVEQRVSAVAVDQPNQRGYYPGRMLFQTDDRGVYRIFGIRAGRYKVAVGLTRDGLVGGSAPSPGYQPVFYPNVTNEDQAKVIEVSEGDQATNVDIVMSRAVLGFAATGTVINSETNQPVNNVRVALQKSKDENNSFVSITAVSNLRGEFRLENIPPGTYSIFLMAQLDNELRADSLEFQVIDQDVGGLVLHTMRGASVSGTVVVEGINDKAVMAKVSQLQIFAWVQGGSGNFARPSRVSSDGKFRISPLADGIANFQFSGLDYNQQTGFILLRIERDGVVVPRGAFAIKSGEQISGVRIVLAYGSGSVRGSVNFENGPPTPGSRFLARLSKAGDNELQLPPREVDTRGRFLIEGVAAGTYEISVIMFSFVSAKATASSVPQSITVVDGAVTDVVISIDLARKP